MAIAPNSYAPRHRNQPRAKRPRSAGCDTTRTCSSASTPGPLQAYKQGSLAVAVHCSKCRRSRVLQTDREHLAALPSTVVTNRDLVHRDNGYFHCGKPVVGPGSQVETTLRTFPADDQAGPGESLASYLATRVLRCRCGFQMELPRRNHSKQH
jgi:hypothetical protein